MGTWNLQMTVVNLSASLALCTLLYLIAEERSHCWLDPDDWQKWYSIGNRSINSHGKCKLCASSSWDEWEGCVNNSTSAGIQYYIYGPCLYPRDCKAVVLVQWWLAVQWQWLFVRIEFEMSRTMDERVHCTTSNPARPGNRQAEYLVANRTGHQHWMRIEMVIPVTREFQLRSPPTLLVVAGGFAILWGHWIPLCTSSATTRFSSVLGGE